MQPENTPPNPESDLPLQEPMPVEQPALSPAPVQQPVTPEPTNTVLGPTQAYSNPYNPISPQPQGKRPKKALLAGAIVATVVIILGASAGAYFGIIVPNKPEKLWDTSLTRTGMAYDQFVASGKKREEKKGGTFDGNFKFDSKDTVVDGTITAKYDEKNANLNMTAGASGVRLNFDLLATTPDNTSYPDIYARVTGLKDIDKLLGADSQGVGSMLASYDNQWYVADHTLFDQIAKESPETADSLKANTLSKDQLNAIYDAVGRVNREYIFTNDSTKAVINRASNVGPEKFDGRDTYHYKASVNKDHLKSYVDALSSELKKTELKSSIKDTDTNDIKTQIDKLDTTNQADVWVDKKTKLIRNVRIVTDDAKKEYIDIGQKYNGGDDIPFAVSVVSKDEKEPGTLNILITLSNKSDNVTVKADADFKDTNNKEYKLNFGGTLKPSNDQVKIDKPANAKSFTDLIAPFLSDGANSGDDTNAVKTTTL